MKTPQLSSSMLAVLAYTARHKGLASVGMNYPNDRKSCKALETLGLLAFVGATHWRHGIGNRVQYKLTPSGRELVLVGRMLRSLHATEAAPWRIALDNQSQARQASEIIAASGKPSNAS